MSSNEQKFGNVTIVMGDSLDTSPRAVAKRIRERDLKPQKCGHGPATCPTECTYAEYARAPRFVVKPAAEMREGEPCWRFTENDVATGCAARYLKKGNDGDVAGLGSRSTWGEPCHPLTFVSALVDTHSPEWKAFQAKQIVNVMRDYTPARGAGKVTIEQTTHVKGLQWEECAVDETRQPTDTEIVEAWDAVMRGTENQNWLMRRCPDVMAVEIGAHGAVTVTKAEYQAARSRELRRLQQEAREAERCRVVCEGTLAEDY